MPSSNVISFGETTRTLTYEEGLAFIARTRRQLNRHAVALPHSAERGISPEDAADIRFKLDMLEADLRHGLETI